LRRGCIIDSMILNDLVNSIVSIFGMYFWDGLQNCLGILSTVIISFWVVGQLNYQRVKHTLMNEELLTLVMCNSLWESWNRLELVVNAAAIW
jgi:hypothetical protein